MNNIDCWEYVKQSCINFSKNYAKNQTSNRRKLLENLYQLSMDLKDNLYHNCECLPSQQTLELITAKIESIEQEITEGEIFRSRSKWVNNYETVSKFFFNLEKHRYVNKTMSCVILDDGTLCKEQKTILHEQEKFYRTLYTSNPDVNFDLVNNSDVCLTEVQKVGECSHSGRNK